MSMDSSISAWKEPQHHQETFRFLLLGKTGSGKSTTGNTIFGANLFDADESFESVTSQCSLKRRQTEHGLVEIMDSPGLFNTNTNQEEVSALLMQALACLHPGPDAVFYVMKIGRYTDDEFGVYNRLKALLDTSVTKYLIIIFTHGDYLQGLDMKQLLQEAPASLKSILAECQNRYVVFDNVQKTDRAQVHRLFEAVKSLRARNNHTPYQCPRYASVGEKMKGEVARRMREVEAKELKNEKCIKDLNLSLKTTKDQADKAKENFDKKEKQRDAVMEAQRKEHKMKLDQLWKTLVEKEISQLQREQKMQIQRRKFEEDDARLKERLFRESQAESEYMNALCKVIMEKEGQMREGIMHKQEQELQSLKDKVAKMKAKQESSSCVIQ